MAKVLQKLKREVAGDLRFQFAHPSKSLTGYLFTKYWDKQNQPVTERVVSKLGINKDAKVLEIGYGRGHGLQLCHSIIKDGKGSVFGIESSAYMSEHAFSRFYDQITTEKSMSLDSVPVLYNLPYPSKFFDAIYHVDVFYFWKTASIREMCREFYRVLSPGGRLLCGMELNRLRRLENYGVLAEHQYDPMRYMLYLEPAGFCDVKIDYEKIDEGREIQIISARKLDDKEEPNDFDAQMTQLEKQVKQDLAIQDLLKTQHVNTELLRQTRQAQNESSSKTQEAK